MDLKLRESDKEKSRLDRVLRVEGSGEPATRQPADAGQLSAALESKSRSISQDGPSVLQLRSAQGPVGGDTKQSVVNNVLASRRADVFVAMKHAHG